MGGNVSQETLKEISERPLKRVHGVIVPPFISEKWVEEDMPKLALRSDDIWIVSYPKAGSTWTQQIVRLIKNGGKSDETNIMTAIPWVETFNVIPEMDYNYQQNIEEIPSPRAFKSHFSYDLMPCGLPNSTPGRYIYVARNPKDVVVSFYFYSRRVPVFPYMEWDEFFEDFMKGNTRYGYYFDHVLSWWAHKDDENVLFLKYEDMKKNLPLQIDKIAKFIGYNLLPELIQLIVDKTTFKAMKEDRSANQSWILKRTASDTPFMRKGEVGDWKNYLSPEQSERLDTKLSEKLKGSGLEFDFD